MASTPSNGNEIWKLNTQAVKATSNGFCLPGSAVLMALQMVKVQIRNIWKQDGKKADGSDKAKEGDEQLPVTGWVR